MTTIVFVPGSTATRPRIGYSNLLDSDDATVTADEEADGYAKEFLSDWLSHTYWMPTTNGAHYVRASFGVAQPANYFAMYSNSVWETGGTIDLQYSTNGGSVWTTAATIMPVDNSPIYLPFAQILAADWRVRVTSTPAAKLGCVAFGVDLQLQRGDWIGFTPPELGRDTDLTTTISDNGGFLGRSITRNMWSSKLDLDFLTFGWVYESWLPFIKHAERKPFFMLWNENDYADRAAYCWTMKKGDIAHPKISKRIYMSAGLRFSCIATE